MAWQSEWGLSERRAYAKGIDKGRALTNEVPTLLDRFAMAALQGLSKQRAENKAKAAYDIARAMMAERNKLDDEIPFCIAQVDPYYEH